MRDNLYKISTTFISQIKIRIDYKLSNEYLN